MLRPTAHPLALLVALTVGLLASASMAVPHPPLPPGGTRHPVIIIRPDAPMRLPADMRTIETPYYIIRTDVSEDEAAEAVVRMNRMAELYLARTEGFSGRITQKLPFYLFRNRADYHAAGGPPGSDGVFMGTRLMAVAGQRTTERTWHVIQHEGFHQFATSVIRGRLPIWVNEGMAEYFGHAVFTGDGYVSGVIPPQRLARVQAGLRARTFRPIEEMMRLSHGEWNAHLSAANYDQGWSMVHFLAHAENGRYQRLFVAFINDLSRNQAWEPSWQRHFGADFRAFEERWSAWWLDQDGDATASLYAQATTATLASFWARAMSQRQAFQTFEQFVTAARAGELRHHPDDWLPPSLLNNALRDLSRHGTFSLERDHRGVQQLVCRMADGSQWIATFRLTHLGRVQTVNVRWQRPR